MDFNHNSFHCFIWLLLIHPLLLPLVVIMPVRRACCCFIPLAAVLVVNELRSHGVHAAFMECFTATHTVKRVPSAKLDPVYQHSLIHVGGTVLHRVVTPRLPLML
jgi:hypothetical protein